MPAELAERIVTSEVIVGNGLLIDTSQPSGAMMKSLPDPAAQFPMALLKLALSIASSKLQPLGPMWIFAAIKSDTTVARQNINSNFLTATSLLLSE